jgi:hypothetical protein
MAIRNIQVTRIADQTTINAKYFDENGKLTVFSWQSSLPADYWLTETVSEYDALRNARNGVETPGYKTVDETTWEGRVLLVSTATERIMSDVWEDVTTAVVYSPETKGQKMGYYGTQDTDYLHVNVGCTGDYMRTYSAEVDAPEDIIKKWKFDCEQATIRHQHAERERIALNVRNKVTVGKMVKVTHGRKVKPGTVGYVFWVGDNGYGESAGIAITQKKVKKGKYENWADVVFVNTNYLHVLGSESNLGMIVAMWAWDTGRFEDLENYLALGPTIEGWDNLALNVDNGMTSIDEAKLAVAQLFGLAPAKPRSSTAEELAQAQAIIAAFKANQAQQAR